MMSYVQFAKIYLYVAHCLRNFAGGSVLIMSTSLSLAGKPVSLLRSCLGRLVTDEIPERFSSSLPPLFASGRFATFLYSAR